MRERIKRNLDDLRSRITGAADRAGRSADDVRLIAVTKTVGLEEVRALDELGVREMGENRVEVAREKMAAFARNVSWHMIGTVQRRKAREVVERFDTVDSVDRLELADALNRHAIDLGKVVPILIEANVSGEETKHGFEPERLPDVIAALQEMRGLRLDGLMTMAPFVENPEDVRPVFARLRALAERHGLNELSMGMSNDFEVAVEEGATQIRIGTALFA